MKQQPRRYALVITLLALVLVLTVPTRASNIGMWWNAAFTAVTAKLEAVQGALSVGAQNTAPLNKPVGEYETAVIAAVGKASPAVVSITVSRNVPIIENCSSTLNGPSGLFALCEKGTELREVGGGSGFIISADGLVLTNKHVVDDANALYTVFTNDGKKYAAQVLARDPVQDLAVVKIEATGLPTVELGDSDSLQLGQTAIAIGNALGEFRNTVSVGVISGLSRSITASNRGGGGAQSISGLVQTDAAINRGNSGGPLLNLHGQVIGINTAIAQGAQNIGFAIPINRAKRDIESVKAVGTIRTPYLGVRYRMLTPAIATAESLPLTFGAEVREVDGEAAVIAGSPAAQMGIRAGDIIYSVNNVKIDERHPLHEVVNDLNVGQAVTLSVYRNGQALLLTGTVGERPE